MNTMTTTRPTTSLATTRLAALAVLVGGLAFAAPAPAQHAEPASPPPQSVPADAHDAATPVAGHGGADDHAAHGAPAGAADHGNTAHGAEAAHGDGHGESIWVTLARVTNFALLAGIIYLLARKPLVSHLSSRGAQIRKDLVEAAEMKATAAARLAEIEARLAALPAELEQLRTRGAEELEAERARIRAAAEAERDRLVEAARKEIESQTRTARAQLRAEAGALAVEVAQARLVATLTPVEQVALVDRYASQMRAAQ